MMMIKDIPDVVAPVNFATLQLSNRIVMSIDNELITLCATQDQVAAHFNLSTRSLSRRLNNEGRLFTTIMTDSRNSRSKILLENSRL